MFVSVGGPGVRTLTRSSQDDVLQKIRGLKYLDYQRGGRGAAAHTVGSERTQAPRALVPSGLLNSTLH